MPVSQEQIEKNLAGLPTVSADEALKHYEVCRHAIASFNGPIDELESAIGMYLLAPHLGWKPLALIHSKRTFRKYESILGINFKESFPEEGPSAKRSVGYTIVSGLGNFWKFVSGEAKHDELKAVRRELS